MLLHRVLSLVVLEEWNFFDTFLLSRGVKMEEVDLSFQVRISILDTVEDPPNHHQR